MSGLVLLIAFFAVMFFMHRGQGAMGGGMGCCGSGHMQGGHDHESAHEQNHKPDLTSVPEAEFVDVTDEPVKKVNAHREEDYARIRKQNSGMHKR